MAERAWAPLLSPPRSRARHDFLRLRMLLNGFRLASEAQFRFGTTETICLGLQIPLPDHSSLVLIPEYADPRRLECEMPGMVWREF